MTPGPGAPHKTSAAPAFALRVTAPTSANLSTVADPGNFIRLDDDHRTTPRCHPVASDRSALVLVGVSIARRPRQPHHRSPLSSPPWDRRGPERHETRCPPSVASFLNARDQGAARSRNSQAKSPLASPARKTLARSACRIHPSLPSHNGPSESYGYACLRNQRACDPSSPSAVHPIGRSRRRHLEWRSRSGKRFFRGAVLILIEGPD
jgi:hypothetical protein